MGYSEALSFDRNAAVRSTYDSRSSAENSSKEPINFGKVFREKYSESIENTESDNITSASDNSIFFTGASADIFASMPQIRENAFDEEFGAFSEHEDLDSAINFDEIIELDDITETVATEKAEAAALDPFSGFDELSDAMSSEEGEEEDLDMFSDLEELII